MSELRPLVLAALSDGRPRSAREITEEIYGAPVERWRYANVRKVLVALMSAGAVSRERSRTVVPVWIYSLKS